MYISIKQKQRLIFEMFRERKEIGLGLLCEIIDGPVNTPVRSGSVAVIELLPLPVHVHNTDVITSCSHNGVTFGCYGRGVIVLGVILSLIHI